MDTEVSDVDEPLLVGLRQGDEGAFDALYLKYASRIFINIRRMVHDEDVAKNLLQDLFLKIWERRASVDPGQSFRSYLFTIARHLVYDYFRNEALDKKLRVYLTAASAEGYSHIEEEFILEQSKEILGRIIEMLPPQRKLVYKLCKLEGKSYEEVSLQLGISQSTISDHLLKANRFIRAHFLPGSVLMLTLIFNS